jgi:hypothetical protein
MFTKGKPIQSKMKKEGRNIVYRQVHTIRNSTGLGGITYHVKESINNVIFRRLRVTIVAVEPQNYIMSTLVDLQLDAQNSYLFTYTTFIKILYMFRALPCSSSGDLHRDCMYAASGIISLCR